MLMFYLIDYLVHLLRFFSLLFNMNITIDTYNYNFEFTL